MFLRNEYYDKRYWRKW